MTFRDTVLWIWQLPQHLIALFILIISNEWQDEDLEEHLNCKKIKTHNNFIVRNFFESGISLGEYVFLDDIYEDLPKYIKTIYHEYGHTRQSRMLGPLYLIVVGIPSLCNNLWSRLNNKEDTWYYTKYPENWADKLGGVERWK